jgi:hypothetical protein
VNTLTIGGASVSTRGLSGFAADQAFFGGGNVSFVCEVTGKVCVNASVTLLFSGAITGATNSDAFGHGNWKFVAGANFYGEYDGISLREGLDGLPFLHIVNVSTPRVGGLRLAIQSGAFRRDVRLTRTGFILSLPLPGFYRVAVARGDSGRPIGDLCADGGDFPVEWRETLFTEAAVCRGARSPTPDPTASDRPEDAAALPAWMVATVCVAAGLSVVGLIALGCCLMRRTRRDSDRLLLTSGGIPDSGEVDTH